MYIQENSTYGWGGIFGDNGPFFIRKFNWIIVFESVEWKMPLIRLKVTGRSLLFQKHKWIWWSVFLENSSSKIKKRDDVEKIIEIWVAYFPWLTPTFWESLIINRFLINSLILKLVEFYQMYSSNLLLMTLTVNVKEVRPDIHTPRCIFSSRTIKRALVPIEIAILRIQARDFFKARFWKFYGQFSWFILRCYVIIK